MPERGGRLHITARTDDRRVTDWHLGWLWPVACATATALVLFVLTRPAGIVNDDILNLQQHRHGELGELLFFPVFFTQVAPGHRLLTELQLHVGPTDQVVMHALIAALAGASVLVAARIAVRLRGASWWVPALLAIVVAGPAGLAIALWYAAAYHLLPALLAGLVGVLLYVRWRGDPSQPMPRGMPVLSLLAVTVGLLFSIKAALAVAFLLLIEYVIGRRGDLETVVVGLWQDRRVWWAYGALGLLYVAMSQRSGIDPGVGEAATVAAAVAQGVVRMSGPMLLGLAPGGPEYELAGLADEWVAATWLVLLGGVVVIWRRGDAARRGLVTGGLLLLIALAMSAGPRAISLGEVAGLASRYHLEGLVYLVLAVAIGLGRGHPLATGRDVLVRAAAAAGLVALATSTAWSHHRQLSVSHEIASGRWLAALEESLDGIDPPPRVLNGPVPEDVLGLVPGSLISNLDGLVPGLRVVFDSPEVAATEAGPITPLRTEELFSQLGADFAENALVTVTGDPVVGLGALCAPSEVRVTLPLAPHPEPRLLELHVRGSGEVRLEHEARPDLPTEPSPTVRVGEHAAALEEDLDADEAQTAAGDEFTVEEVLLPLDMFGWAAAADLTLAPSGDAPLCITAVRILGVHNDLPRREDLPSGAETPATVEPSEADRDGE